MAGDDFEVIGHIVVDSSGAVGIQTVNNNLEKMEQQAGKTGGMLSTVGEGVGLALGGIAVQAAGMAVGAVTGFFSGAVESASKAEDALAQYGAQYDNVSDQYDKAADHYKKYHDLRSKGKMQELENSAVMNTSIKQMQALGDKISTTTKFTKDSVIQSQIYTEQFTKIGKDVMPRVIATSADLATRMGVDLPQANILLTRALADPVMGIGRLNQQFKLFEPTELKQIQMMAAHGKVAQAQTLILDRLSEKVGGAAKAAGETFAGKMDILNNKMANFQQKIGEAVLPALSKLFDKLSPLIDQALPVLQNILERAAGAFDSIVDGISGFISWLQQSKDPIGDVTKLIGGLLKPLIDNINTVLGDVGVKVHDFFQKGLDIVNSVIDGIKGKVGDIATTIGDGIGKARDAVGNFATDWITKGGNIIHGIVFGVTQFLHDPAGTIEQAIETAITTVAGFAASWIMKGNAIIHQIVAGIEQFLNLPAGSLQQVIDKAVKAIADFANDFLTKGQDIIKSIVDGIKQFIDNPTAKIRELGKNIVKALGDMVKQFIQAGEDIINGIIQGINNKIQEVIKKIQDLGDSISNTIKNALHIGSPSRVMMEIGANVAQGLALGIGNNAFLPRNAIGDLASQMVGAINNNNSQTSNVNNYYFGPTLYRPDESQMQGLTQAFRKS